MSALTSAVVATTPSRQLVEATINDTLSFIRAVGNNSIIRQLLGNAGYSDADTERGMTLARSVILRPKGVVADNPVAIATAEIEAWRTTGFAIAQSALTNLHPEQAAFLFEGLDLVNADESVLTASIFFERCDQLESGKDRKATHKADLAALATLASRGFTKEERKRLRALVAIVATQAAPLPEGSATTTDEHDARFHELRAWLIDWRNVAKIVIKRRDLLLRLGIGKRRAKKVAPAPIPPVVTPVIATPVVTPPAPAPSPILSVESSGPESRAA